MNRPGTLDEVVRLSDTTAFLIFRDSLGRRCAVYVKLEVPAGSGPFPVVIHCPGGGQTIAEADLTYWNRHGFACVSFDWQHGLYDHDPRKKSQWPANCIEQHGPAVRPEQLMIPLATQAVGVIIDWLGKDRRCNSERIGITGISWGGYLTWVANAHEPRLRAAVPVYGCGGLFETGHACRPPVAATALSAWVPDFEPFHLASQQKSPVCYLSGTNDFFGWPRHADVLLKQLSVPHRRAYLPNADHAVDPGASLLAVAWMKKWLAGGPELPPEPTTGGNWWTCSTGDDDRHCWWPGTAPAWATAELFTSRGDDGIYLTSGVEVRSTSAATKLPQLPAIWSDARAGIGWHWGLATTQLHGNEAVSLCSLGHDLTRVTITGNRSDNLGVILRHTADPRWNTPDFAGMKIRLDGLTRPCTELRVNYGIQEGNTRRFITHTVPVDEHGWIYLNKPPAPWSLITRIDLDGIPGPSFILGPFARL